MTTARATAIIVAALTIHAGMEWHRDAYSVAKYEVPAGSRLVCGIQPADRTAEGKGEKE